jgi:hypothetical protein
VISLFRTILENPIGLLGYINSDIINSGSRKKGKQKKFSYKALSLYFQGVIERISQVEVMCFSVLLIDDDPALFEALKPFVERSGEMRVHHTIST